MVTLETNAQIKIENTVILTKQEYYELLNNAIRKDMKNKGISKQNIKNKDVEYPLSNSSIRIVEQIAAGEQLNGFSEKRITFLNKYFNLGVWEISFTKKKD